MVQHAAVKGVLGDRLAPPHHSGHQTGHGIDDGHRGDLPAGQDTVPHRNLEVDLTLHKTLVHPLVVTAEDNHMLLAREGLDDLLPRTRP